MSDAHRRSWRCEATCAVALTYGRVVGAEARCHPWQCLIQSCEGLTQQMCHGEPARKLSMRGCCARVSASERGATCIAKVAAVATCTTALRKRSEFSCHAVTA